MTAEIIGLTEGILDAWAERDARDKALEERLLELAYGLDPDDQVGADIRAALVEWKGGANG